MVLDEAGATVSVFAVNRDVSESMDLSIDLRGMGRADFLEHIFLLRLPAASWNVLRFRVDALGSGGSTTGP